MKLSTAMTPSPRCSAQRSRDAEIFDSTTTIRNRWLPGTVAHDSDGAPARMQGRSGSSDPPSSPFDPLEAEPERMLRTESLERETLEEYERGEIETGRWCELHPDED